MQEKLTIANDSGIAVLQDETPTTDEDGPWPVHGVALSENATTLGGSETRLFWPEATLRQGAKLLEGRPIVKNFHDLEGAAPADDVIGRIEKAGYQPGVGIVFEGKIVDRSIAEKIENEFLDVSVSVGVAKRHRDEDEDAFVVDEIAGFRDIAVVADGAVADNKIEIGTNPAIAALSREALSQPWETLQDDITVSDPVYSGTVEDSWDAPTFEGTYDEDIERARNAALIIRGNGENFSDLSLFVVDGNGNLNLAGLRAAKSRAPQTSDVSGDILDRVQSKINNLVAEEYDLDWETNEASPPESLREAMLQELELTGSTPDRCKTIKDGAMTFDLETSELAQSVLSSSKGSRPTRRFRPSSGPGSTKRRRDPNTSEISSLTDDEE